MINCIIIEDQLPAQRILKNYISRVENLVLDACFIDAISALEYLKREKVDLLFLDIQLPYLTGIDLLKVLENPPAVILTTASKDHAIEGFEMDAHDYLLKPFSFERFIKGVKKVELSLSNGLDLSSTQLGIEKSILIKTGYEFVSLPLDRLLFIKADGDYSFIYSYETKYYSNFPLKYWKEHLPEGLFTQIHRSYLINIYKVDKASSNEIKIKEHRLPIGRVYKTSFLKAYVSR